MEGGEPLARACILESLALDTSTPEVCEPKILNLKINLGLTQERRDELIKIIKKYDDVFAVNPK